MSCERCGQSFPYRRHYCGEQGTPHTDALEVARMLERRNDWRDMVVCGAVWVFALACIATGFHV